MFRSSYAQTDGQTWVSAVWNRNRITRCATIFTRKPAIWESNTGNCPLDLEMLCSSALTSNIICISMLTELSAEISNLRCSTPIYLRLCRPLTVSVCSSWRCCFCTLPIYNHSIEDNWFERYLEIILTSVHVTQTSAYLICSRTMVSIVSIEGTDCRLVELGKVADLTAGQVRWSSR